VEYESRRDADDAYHEMHNKRIGRDDLLKIEVCVAPFKCFPCWLGSSGLAHHPLPRGDSIQDAIGLVMSVMVVTAVEAAVNAHHPVAVVDHPLLVAVTTPRARMTAASETANTMTVAVPVALTTATEKWRTIVDVKMIARTAPMATIEKV
jgi:hypothetical protein